MHADVRKFEEEARNKAQHELTHRWDYTGYDGTEARCGPILVRSCQLVIETCDAVVWNEAGPSLRRRCEIDRFNTQLFNKN